MTELLNNFNSKKEVISIIENENFQKYSLEAVIEKKNIKKFLITKSEYDIIANKIKLLECEWLIKIGFNYIINHIDYSDFNIESLEDNDDNEITFYFELFKNKNSLVIINSDLFLQHINSITLEDNLDYLSPRIQKGLNIQNIDSEAKLSSNKIAYNSILDFKQNRYDLNFQNNFSNHSKFKISPENLDFYIDNCSDHVLNFYSKINFVLCLGFIFDRTSISKNKITLLISNQKTIKYTLDWKDINLDNYLVYKKIVDWIYLDSSKENDRIGIVKNVLIYYLNEKTPNIAIDVFDSIITANNIYIKENVENFINVRNKIHEELENIISLINNAIIEYQKKFEKTIFIFITFFITNYIFEFSKSENLKLLFNSKTTIVGLFILLLGYIYFWYSNKISIEDVERINDRYIKIKNRFISLLTIEDINLILNNDSEFNNEMIFLKKKINKYNQLWYFTLVILFLIIVTPFLYYNTKQDIYLKIVSLPIIMLIFIIRYLKSDNLK